MSDDRMPVKRLRLSTFVRADELAEAAGWSFHVDRSTPVEVIDPPEMADDVLRCVLACGVASVGLQVGIPKTRREFERLLGPPPPKTKWDLDRPFQLDPLEGMSTCMAVVVGWMRDNALWNKPYRPGEGTSRVETYARICKAWGSPSFGGIPSPGTFVILEDHAAMCAMVLEDEGEMLTIDGGQEGAARLQAIFGRRRRLRRSDSNLFLDDRRVRGWIDPALLPRVPGAKCLVPVGWRQMHV